MRISDWSSDVCSSDLASLIEQSGLRPVFWRCEAQMGPAPTVQASASCRPSDEAKLNQVRLDDFLNGVTGFGQAGGQRFHAHRPAPIDVGDHVQIASVHRIKAQIIDLQPIRSEEHTSELQSLIRNPYDA